jgi:hypothetical protein
MFEIHKTRTVAQGRRKLTREREEYFLQRVLECPKLGGAVEQGVPGDVYDAYERLVHDGFDSRLIAP